MTITHTLTESVKHPRATSRNLSRRALSAIESLYESREAAKYRAAYGAKSVSKADIAAMWADPDCPVNKRPRHTA